MVPFTRATHFGVTLGLTTAAILRTLRGFRLQKLLRGAAEGLPGHCCGGLVLSWGTPSETVSVWVGLMGWDGLDGLDGSGLIATNHDQPRGKYERRE